MIKQGYKKTAVGIIPEEWGVKRFDKCFRHLRAYTFSRNELDYEGGDNIIYNIHYGDIHSTFPKNLLDVKKDIAQIPRIKNPDIKEPELLKNGDLVMADASEDYEGIGQSIELINIENEKIVSGTHTFPLRPIEKFAPRYAGYIFSNFDTHKEIKKIATGISVFGISKANIAKVNIPIPPLPEQKAIADCLSTWDKAIEKQIQLIEFKKEFKKGLMQGFFNGSLTVKDGKVIKAKEGEDFTEDWEEIMLRDVIKVQGGYAFKSSKFKEFGIPVIRISNLDDKLNIITFDDIVYYDKISNKQFKVAKGDMMIAMSGATTGKTAIYTKDDIAYLNQRVGLFKNKDENIFHYPLLYFLVKTEEFENEIKKLLSTGAQPNISSSEIESVKIKIPTIEFQIAIAQVLQSADKEIGLLEQKLSALEKQKKGLMQVLLTGEKRLV